MEILKFILEKPEFIGALLVALGIAIGVKDNKKARFIQMFSHYTERYMQIMSQFPEKARRVSSLKELSEEEQASVWKVFRNYMNLCSEEMFLMDSGYIDKKAWNIWKQGIQSTLGDILIFSEIWTDLQKEYSSFPKFQNFIASITIKSNQSKG